MKQVHLETKLYLVRNTPTFDNSVVDYLIEGGVLIAKGRFDTGLGNPSNDLSDTLQDNINKVVVLMAQQVTSDTSALTQFIKSPIPEHGYAISKGLLVNKSTLFRIWRQRTGNAYITRLLMQTEYDTQSDVTSLQDNAMFEIGRVYHTAESLSVHHWDIFNTTMNTMNSIMNTVVDHRKWSIPTYNETVYNVEDKE